MRTPPPEGNAVTQENSAKPLFPQEVRKERKGKGKIRNKEKETKTRESKKKKKANSNQKKENHQEPQKVTPKRLPLLR